MKPRTKRLLLVLGCLLLVAAAGTAWLAYSFFSPDSARNREEAVVATLKWGRLAPFPVSAQQFAISTSGGMFTRSFRVSFLAPPADIEHWLQQSPGTREVVPTASSPSSRHFEVAPGGGAVQAEVTVDDTQHRVSIYVCWS